MSPDLTGRCAACQDVQIGSCECGSSRWWGKTGLEQRSDLFLARALPSFFLLHVNTNQILAPRPLRLAIFATLLVSDFMCIAIVFAPWRELTIRTISASFSLPGSVSDSYKNAKTPHLPQTKNSTARLAPPFSCVALSKVPALANPAFEKLFDLRLTHPWLC